MQNMQNIENLGLNITRSIRDHMWRHVYISSNITDKSLISSKDNCFFILLRKFSRKDRRNLPIIKDKLPVNPFTVGTKNIFSFIKNNPIVNKNTNIKIKININQYMFYLNPPNPLFKRGKIVF